MSDLVTMENIRRLSDQCQLQPEQYQIIQQHMKTARIERKMIRDVLCEEGRHSKKAFYLLEGHVNVNATVFNAERLVLSQVGKEQLLNLQIVLNNWINKYTITVSSSFIKYITFQEKEIKILTEHIMPELQRKMDLKQREINKRNKQLKQASKKKRLEENINKLILPEIMPSKKNSIINLEQSHTQQILSIKDLPLFSKELKKQGRSSSLSKLKSVQSRYSEPLGLFEKNMDAINQHVIDKFQQQRIKVVQNKLERLKSERSISINQKQIKQFDYSRNQKLFKQHLKNIVKRKLLFERKHFKILTNFKNDKKEVYQPDEVIKKYEDNPDNNPIDNYFVM